MPLRHQRHSAEPTRVDSGQQRHRQGQHSPVEQDEHQRAAAERQLQDPPRAESVGPAPASKDCNPKTCPLDAYDIEVSAPTPSHH
ncbi:hypothetical protein [Saccharopolyspora spinosa]|uniref:hypothetical protein n=1 Tax=Saccharopolyspora spinosa TaxID=60894 RepID=UPI000C6F2F09|nr:hypothetical protein [Saccharopolyspora spinosa]